MIISNFTTNPLFFFIIVIALFFSINNWSREVEIRLSSGCTSLLQPISTYFTQLVCDNYHLQMCGVSNEIEERRNI